MDDKVDDALKVQNLQRKLDAIENSRKARRNKTIFSYGIVMFFGATGLVSVTICCLKGMDSPLYWIICILSMLLILIPILCLRDERGGRR